MSAPRKNETKVNYRYYDSPPEGECFYINRNEKPRQSDNLYHAKVKYYCRSKIISLGGMPGGNK